MTNDLKSRMLHYMQWLVTGATGLSSKCLFAVMLNLTPETLDHPYDPSDFARCHKLLEWCPEWRERMPEMARISPTWAAMAREWESLTALYLEEVTEGTGNAPRLYKRMQELRGIQ